MTDKTEFVEEAEITVESLPSLMMSLDEFSHLFVRSYNDTLFSLGNENAIDGLDFTVLQDGYFFIKLYKVIQLIGTLNPNKEISMDWCSFGEWSIRWG